MSRSQHKNPGFRHLFGPVPSRRLGLSLGVDIIPPKTCTLNCIYCELGQSAKPTLNRAAYVPSRVILGEIKRLLAGGQPIDYITFSGCGEPTLNSQLGKMITEVKKITGIPVAVITNGTLLWRPDVRRRLAQADVVLPSLDSALLKSFRLVNRPHPGLKLGQMIEGLKKFRKEYRGQIWLEVMLVRGVNDRPADLKALKKVIAEIKPDRIQLNTVVRPPAESRAKPLAEKDLTRIRRQFGPNCEVIASFKSPKAEFQDSRLTDKDRPRIYQLVKRRPVTEKEIIQVLSLPAEEVAVCLAELLKTKKIKSRKHQSKVFYSG